MATIGGVKTVAATSQIQINAAELVNERVVNDVLSNQQKSDGSSIVKITPDLKEAPPRTDSRIADDSVL